MPTLFEAISIKSMKLRNRIARSAMAEGMCDGQGRPLPELADYYARLAAGGVGLIITGYTFVCLENKPFPGVMGIHTDDFAQDFHRLTRSAHSAGAAVAVQIGLTGGQADPGLSDRKPKAPSAIKAKQYQVEPEALTIAEIKAITTAFGQAAARARAWGFDAVQLHGAHGYLINQFLSPLTNQRTDEYGGGIENRSRFLMRIYSEIRQKVGDDYPVMIKLNGSDNLDGGLSPADGLEVARRLDAAGIDGIEITAGTAASGKRGQARTKIDTPEKEAYNLDLARRIKDAVTCPVMLVGGIRSYEVAQKAVRHDGMDCIAMARPMIREPGLPGRWRGGDRAPAKCISCNGCFVPLRKEGRFHCVVEKKEQAVNRCAQRVAKL